MGGLVSALADPERLAPLRHRGGRGLMLDGLRAAAEALGVRARSTPLRFARLPLYPKQSAIVDDPARFTICEATTKAGKTMSHLEWLLDEGIRANEGHWWWVATVNDVADIAFRRAMDRLRGRIESNGRFLEVGDPTPFHPNRTRKFITVGGATFWFKSADEPDSLFGEDVRAAVGDEITRWKEEAWYALYTTLTATKGRAKLIGNVKGRRNFAYRLARKAEGGEADWGYHKLTADDAIAGGVIDAAVVEQARRDLPPEVFAELYMAEAADDQGNPFGFAAIKACLLDGMGLAAGPAVAWGWDLGKSIDFTVGIALNANGEVCHFDRFQRPWPITMETIKAVTVGGPAEIDSTGLGDPIFAQLTSGSAGEFRSFKFSASSKQQLMEGLAVAIQNRTIRFPDGPIRAELEAFEYEYTRTGTRYSAPQGLHDDCVCALALAVRAKGTSGPAAAPVVTESASYWNV